MAATTMPERQCAGKGKWNTTHQWSFTVLNPCDLETVLFHGNFYTLQEIADTLPTVASFIKLRDMNRGHTKIPDYLKLERLHHDL